MNEDEYFDQILEQSKKIRQNNRTSCIELENYLYYQFLKLTTKNTLIWSCGICSNQQTQTKKQFRRAFKQLTKIQQAEFYLMNVRNVQKFLWTRLKNNQNDDTQIIDQTQSTSPEQSQIKLQIKDGNTYKKFSDVTANINQKDNIIKIKGNKLNIDLHYYILRKSRKTKANCLVLEAMKQRIPQTIRLQFSSNDFSKLSQQITNKWNAAQYENIKKMLLVDNKFPRKVPEGVTLTTNSTLKFPQYPSPQYPKQQPQNQISLLPPPPQPKPTSMTSLQKNPIPPQLFQSLNNYHNFIQQTPGLYFQKNGNKVKKLFQFNTSDITIAMIRQAIDSIQHIKLRKPTISSIQLLNSIPTEQTNIYHEINSFDNQQYQFLYFRHFFTKNNTAFFLQKSIDLQQYQNNNQSLIKSIINYCIWRITIIGDKIQLFAQADISYNNHITDAKKITTLYLGEFLHFLRKDLQIKKTQILNDAAKIDDNLFENQNMSQIRGQLSFYTVTGSLQTSSKQLSDHYMSGNHIDHTTNSKQITTQPMKINISLPINIFDAFFNLQIIPHADPLLYYQTALLCIEHVQQMKLIFWFYSIFSIYFTTKNKLNFNSNFQFEKLKEDNEKLLKLDKKIKSK